MAGNAVIPNDWTGDYCFYSVRWPKSEQWLSVLRGVLTIAAEGRFWNGETGIIIDAQAIIRATYDYNLRNLEVLLDCDNGTLLVEAVVNLGLQLTQAINGLELKSTNNITVENNELTEEILQIMANNCTCNNCPGSGSSSTPTMPAPNPCNYQNPFNPPSVTPPGDTFPSTFGSLEMYNSYRCQVAHAILNAGVEFARKVTVGNLVGITAAFFGLGGTVAAIDLIQTTFGIEALATIGIGTATLAAIILPLLLTVAAILLTISHVSFDDIGNLLEAAQDGIICDLLAAVDATDAKQVFLSAISTILTLNNVPLDGWIVSVFDNVFGLEVFYRLFKDGRGEMGDMSALSTDCPCESPVGASCQHFDIDVDGWESDATYADFELVAAGDVSWDGGQLILDTGSAGGVSSVGAKGPTFEHVIVDGDVICFNVIDIASGSYAAYVAATIDGSEVEINTFSGLYTAGLESFSLNDHIGQTISQVWIAWAQTGVGFTVKVEYAGVNCVECMA
jgi:hypothetical protein